MVRPYRRVPYEIAHSTQFHPPRPSAAPLQLLAATLGGNAVGDPAVACAAPNQEWDVTAFDKCIQDVIFSGHPNKSFTAEHKRCCTETGGQWNESTHECVAPPVQPADAQQPTLPGVAPRPGVATQEPAPAPIRNPEVTATFQPAPVGPVG